MKSLFALMGKMCVQSYKLKRKETLSYVNNYI